METEIICYSCMCPMCAHGEHVSIVKKRKLIFASSMTYCGYCLCGGLIGWFLSNSYIVAYISSQIYVGFYTTETKKIINEKYNLETTICSYMMPFLCTPVSIIQDDMVLNSVELEDILIESTPYEIKDH